MGKVGEYAGLFRKAQSNYETFLNFTFFTLKIHVLYCKHEYIFTYTHTHTQQEKGHLQVKVQGFGRNQTSLQS